MEGDGVNEDSVISSGLTPELMSVLASKGRRWPRTSTGVSPAWAGRSLVKVGGVIKGGESPDPFALVDVKLALQEATEGWDDEDRAVVVLLAFGYTYRQITEEIGVCGDRISLIKKRLSAALGR
jgi:DNA-directed RNA polymerase specialized sigma24 family protein